MNAALDPHELADVVQAAMERWRVPGVAVGILHAGREHATGFGVTSLEQPRPVTPDTLFQIGSITKTFTATAVMRLVEQGRLALDTPVRAYLPALRLADGATAAALTLRHLLTHLGGFLGDYFADFGGGDDALARYVASLVELPQLTPLGALWSYNNAGFSLAGHVIEAVTGQPFETALRELVLAPLGLTRASFWAAEVITESFAVGHLVDEQATAVARPWALPRSAHAAGGLIASVPELLRYARFHLGDGTTATGVRLLTAESVAQMQTPQTPADSRVDAWGLSWALTDAGGTRTVGHGGATHGQTALFTLAPARGFAVVLLTNASRGRELNGEVTAWALRRYLGASAPEPAPLAMPPEQLAAYAGRYTAVLDDAELIVEDSALVMRVISNGGFPLKDSPPVPSPPPTRLAFYAPDRVVALDPPLRGARADFIRAPDGRIAWFRTGGRLHRPV
jgi:CubicO group peptidase (beta-lactamase class C family)